MAWEGDNFPGRKGQRVILKKSLNNHENNSKQEDNNCDFIDPMHHFYIEVTRSGWIFFSKKVSQDFSHLKVFFN